MDLMSLTAVELGKKIQAKEVTVEEAVKAAIASIKAKEEKINSFVTIDEEGALKKAAEVQAKIDAGELKGALAGVPVAIKDNMCTEGLLTTCSSKILYNFIPTYTAEAVKRLEDAGCVIVGKTNMDEFAMGSTTETSAFGATKNPWNTEHVPGGSSGGSCAAVAAEEVPFALGSDTGGSIRQPSSFCGVTGIKPTYGTVSRYGLIAYGSSLDQIGPIAKDVTDCATILEAIASYDTKDSTSVNRDNLKFTEALVDDVKGMKIGIPKDYLGDGLDPEVKSAILAAADELKKKGAVVEEFDLGLVEYAIPAYYVIACAEASSNLARFDGVKYGYRTKEYTDLHNMYKKSRSEGFGPEVKRRIMLGSFVLSSGYYDAYYLKALRVKALIKKAFDDAFAKYDVILGPAAPTTAPKLGESLSDPIQMYLGDIYTISVNLAGLPGISLPCGMDKNGLPIGLQLIGDCFKEKNIIRAAYSFEKTRELKRSKWSTYETVRYQYLPLKDLYYDKDHGKENKNYQYGNQSYVRVLMVVAFLVGIIGLLNFINIYTVIMSKRSREFGVKKVFGAGRTDIFLQIYAENILLTGLALLLCWALIEITRFFFFHELYIPTTTDSGFDRKVSAIVLLGLPLLTTVYPFLKYTCSRPVNSIRELASSRFSTRSRMILLCFQYVVTIFIITVSLFFVRQLEYMLCADLGFRSHDVITCRMYVDKLGLYKTTKEEGLDEGKRQYISNALVNKRMSESTLFEHWSRGNDLLFTDFRFDSFALNRAENGFHPALSAHLTTHSMAIYDFQLVEGRLWNDSIDEAFTKNSFKVIINETAKRVYGIKDITKDKLQPEEPHYASSSLPDFYNPPCEIVGVIKDFNVRHLSQSIQPVVIYYHDASIGGIYTVTASYKHENKAKVIDFLRRLYEESTGRTDFEYTLIEDELQKMYREDRQVVNIYTLFAGIAIFISSLGLLSISLFDIQQRYREIGLRKEIGRASCRERV